MDDALVALTLDKTDAIYAIGTTIYGAGKGVLLKYTPDADTRAATQISLFPAQVRLGQTFNLTARLRTGTTPVANRFLYFSIGNSIFGPILTDTNGLVSVPYTLSQGGGESGGFGGGTLSDLTIIAAFKGDQEYKASQRTGTLKVLSAQTASNVDIVTGKVGQTVTLRATLYRIGDNLSLNNRTVTFKVAGNVVGTATTDNDGVATINYPIPDSLSSGHVSITVQFAGSPDYEASNSTGTLFITPSDTAISVFPRQSKAGKTVTLLARLRRGSAPISGRTLTFKLGDAIVGAAVTGSDGLAAIDYVVPYSLTGKVTLTVIFAGDSLYNPSSNTGSLTIIP